MPDHVHLLIRKHRDLAESMIAQLQDASRKTLQKHGCRSAEHPVWGGPGWKVFLESRDDIQRTVDYVRGNRPRGEQCAQAWSFVRLYDGWLPGQMRTVPRMKRD
jgi:REP element-mobilizing transposase RayT